MRNDGRGYQSLHRGFAVSVDDPKSLNDISARLPTSKNGHFRFCIQECFSHAVGLMHQLRPPAYARTASKHETRSTSPSG